MNRYINTYLLRLSNDDHDVYSFASQLSYPSKLSRVSHCHPPQSPTDSFPVKILHSILPLIWPPAHRPRASTQLSDSLSCDLNMNGPDSQMDRHRYKHSANICLHVTRYVLPSMAMEGALTLCKYIARTTHLVESDGQAFAIRTKGPEAL
jgi:hypothetical protein